MANRCTSGLYLAFARKAFRQRVVYRTDLLVGVVNHFLSLFIQVSVWRVLLANGTTANGVTIRDMVTYIIIGMIVSSLTRSRIDRRIAERIEDGSIAMDFIRPVNFKYYMICEDAGENAFTTLFTTLPACAFGACWWGLRLPENPLTIPLFVATLAGGVAMTCYLNYITGLVSFWFKTAFHVDWVFGTFALLFSGSLVPLWFYPAGLRAVSEALPWQLATFAPLAIFLEKSTTAGAIRVLCLEVVWFVVLAGLERVLWAKAQQKVEVYGG